MDRFLVPEQGPFSNTYTQLLESFPLVLLVPSSLVVCSGRFSPIFCSAFRFPSGKFWFPVSASSKVSCPAQLIGSLSCMPSFLIPCPGQFILSLPCLVLRLHVLFKTPFPSPGQFLVFLSCSVLRFSNLAHFQFPRPGQFPVSLTNSVFRADHCPIPHLGQFTMSLSCSVLRFYALISSLVLCLCQFSVFMHWTVLQFPTYVSFPFLRPLLVLCFPVLSSSPFPYPGQFSGFLSWPVFTSHFCPA
jgi:hypothetical protein